MLIKYVLEEELTKSDVYLHDECGNEAIVYCERRHTLRLT